MPKHVMIVDDDMNNVDFLSTVLKKNGYDFTSANDGEEGLKKLQQSEKKPDLMILDVMMPRKTGFVLFKQMKKEEALKNIPVIMLTGVAGVVEEVKSASDRSETTGEIKEAFEDKLEKMVGHKRHQGVVAFRTIRSYDPESKLWEIAENDEAPLFILPSSLEDPGNLGAIIRSAAAFGASAVLLERKGSVQLNGTVAKTSAGMIEQMTIVKPNRPPT